MAYIVEEANGIGSREILDSMLLNTSLNFKEDAVKTTLSLQTLFSEKNKSLRKPSSHSALPLPDTFSGWVNIFKLRRMSSMAGTCPLDDETDTFNDFSVYCEQIFPNKTISLFKLFTSSSQEESALALDSLNRTLHNFADTTLPAELMRELVLPQPKTLSELPRTILDYITARKEGYSSLVNLRLSKFPLAYHACSFDRVDVLKILIANGADMLFEDNHTGNTLIHIAAKYSHSCLVSILDHLKNTYAEEKFYQLINKVNHSHMESKRMKNPAKMQTVSLALAEINFLGLAPHRISPEPQRKCASGITPLMMASGEGNIKTAGVLLTAGADPNVKDPGLGTTALHIAASTSNIPLVQLLVSFDASIQAKNDDGQTPLDLARDSKEPTSEECVRILETVSTLRKQAEVELGNVKTSKLAKNGAVLLCIDGGGTRALVPAFLLGYIQKRMLHNSRKKPGQTSGINITRYFDWFSGTSAGSSLICSMVYNNEPPGKFLTSIVAERDKLFSGNRIYSEEGLEEFIQGLVGDDRFVDELKEPKMIIPTTLSDQNPPKSFLINNYRLDPSGRRWKVHEAIHASAAAPTYFPAFEKKYVDGGLMVPNPTLITMTEALNNGDTPIAAVVSLGTGAPPITEVNLLDLIYPRMTSLVSDIKQNLQYFHQLIDMLTANMTNMDHSVAQARAWCGSIGAKYYRLSPQLSTAHDLDSKDDGALADIFYETYLYQLENVGPLEEVAITLLENGHRH